MLSPLAQGLRTWLPIGCCAGALKKLLVLTHLTAGGPETEILEVWEAGADFSSYT